MPKVIERTKSNRGKEHTCVRCGEVIKPYQTYYTWTFRMGGSRYQHTKHGYPRQSQLTTSKMGAVFSAQEAALDELDQMEKSAPGPQMTDEDYERVGEIVQEVVEATRNVIEEYEEAAENFGQGGPNQERAEGLEDWVTELESFSPPDQGDSDKTEIIEAAREVVSEEPSF